VSSYGNEQQLRDLLAAQPTLIPGLADPVAAVTELYVPEVGYVDVVAIDGTGNLTIVECKLASNPEIRRQVLGQVLAYAAGLWRLDLSHFENLWRARQPDRHGIVHAVFGVDHESEDAEALPETIRSALTDGRFSLVLAVDSITPELRRTVEYLNAHTAGGVSVLALELRYAKEGPVEMIIPTVFGVELAAAVTRPGSQPRRWTEEDVIAALEEQGPETAELGTRLLDHYRDRVKYFYFGEAKRPSVTAVFETSGGNVQPFSLYVYEPPLLSANFDWTRSFPDDARRAFVESVAAIPGSGIDAAAVLAAGLAKRPSLRWADLPDRPKAIGLFIEALDRLLTSDSATRVDPPLSGQSGASSSAPPHADASFDGTVVV
jgi:hypothetical protein